MSDIKNPLLNKHRLYENPRVLLLLYLFSNIDDVLLR